MKNTHSLKLNYQTNFSIKQLNQEQVRISFKTTLVLHGTSATDTVTKNEK